MATIGENIRTHRDRMGFTQRQLADRANTSRGYISDLETNRYAFPSISMLFWLAQALEVAPSDLLADVSMETGMPAEYLPMQGFRNTVPAVCATCRCARWEDLAWTCMRPGGPRFTDRVQRWISTCDRYLSAK